MPAGAQALRKEMLSEPTVTACKNADIVTFAAPTSSWRHPADMHKGVYLIALGCWAAFLSVFWVTFGASANALFVLVVCAFYATVFFSVPVILTRLFPEKMPVTGDLMTFLRRPFATIDGAISGFEALVQVIVVPLSLAIGGLAIGFIIHAARAAH